MIELLFWLYGLAAIGSGLVLIRWSQLTGERWTERRMETKAPCQWRDRFLLIRYALVLESAAVFAGSLNLLSALWAGDIPIGLLPLRVGVVATLCLAQMIFLWAAGIGAARWAWRWFVSLAAAWSAAITVMLVF